MVKVKICGVKTGEDLELASGADAVGFIVSTPKSSRNLGTKRAARLAKKVPPFTSTVLVTTETDLGHLEEVTREIGPDYLQLHSQLEENRVNRIARAIPGKTGVIGLLSINSDQPDPKERARSLERSSAAAVVLDSKAGDRAGGTGRVHDWEISRKIRDLVYPFPTILAGGLDPENVGEAIEKVRPFAVDVATGVEEEGEKSPRKTKSFLHEVRSIAT